MEAPAIIICGNVDCRGVIPFGQVIGLLAYGLEGDYCRKCVSAFLKAKRRFDLHIRQVVKRVVKPPVKLLPPPKLPVALLPARTLTRGRGEKPAWELPLWQNKAYLNGWLENDYRKRGEKVYGPYRYLRWRDPQGVKRSHYIGRVL